MTEQLQRARAGSDAVRRLVDELAERLQRSVVLDDPLVRFIHASRHFDDADPVRIRSLLQGVADSEAIRYVLDQGVAQWTKPGYIEGRDDLGLLSRYCVPLRERGRLLGMVMVVSAGKDLTAHETDAIAQSTRAIAAQMYAEHVADHAEGSGVPDLPWALLDASPTARRVAQQQILDTGVLPDARHSVVSVVQVVRSHEPPGQIETALRAALERFCRTRSAHGAVAFTPDRAVLLQLSEQSPTPQELKDQSRRIIEALDTFLDPSAAPVLGIGGCQTGVAEAWVSYEQALVAARAARQMPHFERVGEWEELREFAVLLQLPDHALNASLLPKPLRALLSAAGGQGPRLEETLRSFLEHAGSVPKTAEALQIHRTSLYYRLRQIQEITSLDLDSGADRLVLHLGLRIRDLLQPDGPATTV
ncbi:CdaR family transcriptional regulator [Streptomyces sp. C3-3]|uniref:PucR family transcriptional regulator n=1 Tax=Streptomyces sp. C3-3 TaxID=2824901 RepID=UPI001B38029C|nr:helix-turn-helix domain-containing protein [Streptomyces sp. C3-3]MBQ1115996.1 helix-turn-helix domain-containing protein [Streptomyces sp. C3-3]